MSAALRRFRIALAGMILPAGVIVLMKLTDAEIAEINADFESAMGSTFCDEPTCLCRAQVLTTEPEVGI